MNHVTFKAETADREPRQQTGVGPMSRYTVCLDQFKEELVEHYDFLEKNGTPEERQEFAQGIYALGIKFNYAEQARRQGYDHETAKKNNGLLPCTTSTPSKH